MDMSRIEREKRVVGMMVRLYCRKQEGNDCLCASPAAFSAAYRVYSNVFYNVYTKFYVLQTDNAPNGHAHTPTKPGTPRTNNRSLPASVFYIVRPVRLDRSVKAFLH